MGAMIFIAIPWVVAWVICAMWIIDEAPPHMILMVVASFIVGPPVLLALGVYALYRSIRR